MSISMKYVCNKCDYFIYGYKSWMEKLSETTGKNETVMLTDEDYQSNQCPRCGDGVLVEDEKSRTWLHEKKPKETIKSKILFPRYTAIVEEKRLEAVKQTSTLKEDRSAHNTKQIDFNNIDTTIDPIGEQIVASDEVRSLEKNGGMSYISKIKLYTEYLNHPPYSILSYHPNGKEKYIKVVTSLESNNEYPIVLNREEIVFMEQNQDNYFVYRLLSFNKKRKSARLEIYCGKDDICNRLLGNKKYEAIIQAFITHDNDFSLINENEEVITQADYMDFATSDKFLWSIRGLSERELIIFTKSLFLYERGAGLFNKDTPISKILDLPVLKNSDEYKSLTDWLVRNNKNPYSNHLKYVNGNYLNHSDLPNDHDTARKELARDLVKHLEMVGQIPKTDPIELERKLAESFPLAKDPTP